ncbi:MAG TPA: DUF3300 domain-containing protein [Vicinamibacteria bacterium]|nr:DUF3300 domain-containing protein [Vicinamibacteria bacterium]
MAYVTSVHEVALMAVVGVATAGIASTTAQTQASRQPSSKAAPVAKLPPEEVDGLMAPVALYSDQLLAQMLVSATTPARVKELDAWLKTKPPFTGSALQDAARQTGYEPSLVALVIFPQVVDFMATNLDWTTEVGRAFSSNRAGVLDSVQRLRADALASGKLKTTPQQTVSLKTLDSGQNIIIIEPANAQVVHVPHYDPKTVYTEAPTSTTVVIQEEDDDAAEAMAAGLIGFTAGIAIGAAIDNDYYYGPYGWHGAPYMYNDAWDDWYDDREDAREDWYEHREDAREDVLEHREDMAETRGDRAANAQEQRTERSETQTQTAQSRAASYEARGQNRDRSSTAAARSGTASDAFSNYSSGRSERSASARGKRSRSSGRRRR